MAESIKNLCNDCAEKAICQYLFAILRQDNEGQINQHYPKIFTITVVYSCEYYKKEGE